MKPIHVDLSASGNDVQIVPLADFHIGDKQSNIKMVNNIIDTVLNTPDMYCTLGGDLMDTAISASCGDTYGANMSPMEQIKFCEDLFGDLARAGKILAILPGNHEHRIYKDSGIDTTALFADQLGLYDRYSDTTALLFVDVGNRQRHKQQYVIYQTHGSGGGRKAGAKINRLMDYANIVDADIYICAHTHMPAAAKMSYFRPIKNHYDVSQVEKLFVNTASALGYGGYGDVQGYTPASNSYPVITLYADDKRATCMM